MSAATRGMISAPASVQSATLSITLPEPLEARAQGAQLALGLAQAPLEAPHGHEHADESERLDRRRDGDDSRAG